MKVRVARGWVCVLLLPLGWSAFAQKQVIDFRIVKEGVLEKRLRLAHPNVKVRYERLRNLFLEMGCKDLREQPVKGSKEPNLICPVSNEGSPDASPFRIIVGAHFDSAGGDGLIDNWTGAILLPSLAEFTREKPRKHAFEFVGFAAEEKGLVGSEAYLKALSPVQRRQIAAVLTMDSLGLTPTKFWPNSSDRELWVLAYHIARAMNLPFDGVNVDAVGSTDSMTFYRRKIPVLSLHSVTTDTWRLIYSPKDVWASLSWKDYYDSHRLVSAILAYFDEKLP